MTAQVLEELLRSPPFAAAISILGFVLAVSGGRAVAHRSLATRLFTLRGAPAVAAGVALLAVGLAVVAAAWIHGLHLLE